MGGAETFRAATLPASIAWRETPIPAGTIRSTAAFRAVPVDLKARHHADPLIDVSTAGLACESFYARSDGLNAPYYRRIEGAEKRLRARAQVIRKLAQVNRRLRPFGVELFVLDAFRTIRCQLALWEFFVAKIAADKPHFSQAEVEKAALKYCSDPRGFDPEDSRTWPTHSTGGAIDLTLRRRGAAEPLFMGGIFDDPTAVSHTDYFERGPGARQHSSSAEEARASRRLLYWAMRSADFVNLPTEWWHYDWGTQLWAYKRLPAAHFGPAASRSLRSD